jgi:hypothetical protein
MLPKSAGSAVSGWPVEVLVEVKNRKPAASSGARPPLTCRDHPRHLVPAYCLAMSPVLLDLLAFLREISVAVAVATAIMHPISVSLVC